MEEAINISCLAANIFSLLRESFKSVCCVVNWKKGYIVLGGEVKLLCVAVTLQHSDCKTLLI